LSHFNITETQDLADVQGVVGQDGHVS